MLRNRSWASLMLKARSRFEEISLLWSFFTLLTNPSRPPRGRFFATTRRPQHGLGLAVILLPSISDYYTNTNPFHKEIQTLKKIMHIRMYPSLNCIIKRRNPKSPDPEEMVRTPLPPKVRSEIQTGTKRKHFPLFFTTESANWLSHLRKIWCASTVSLSFLSLHLHV